MEDREGERCCDAAEEVIGDSALDQLRQRALTVIAQHRHG
jgi:hypothetical protein